MTSLTRFSLLGGLLACLVLTACTGGPQPDPLPVAPRGAVPVGFDVGVRTETRDFDFNKEAAP